MACYSCLLTHFSQIELRDDGFGARRAVVIACRAESAASSQDIRVGDEIISIMVMGKNCEYDGLDLIELLSEDFEVNLHAHVFAACSRLIASTAQPAYDRIMHTLHGCSGTLVSPIAAFSMMLPSIFKQLLELISLRGTRVRLFSRGAQVVLSITRAGLPAGHVCLFRDGSIEEAAALVHDSAGRVRRVSF
jgi:hypothetical protein